MDAAWVTGDGSPRHQERSKSHNRYRDLDRNLKKFIANFERRLGSQKTMRRLHLFLRSKFKPKASLPTLEDQTGVKLYTDSAKAEALDLLFTPTAVSSVLKDLKPS
ncbi:hypothetical protein GCK32_000810, partial [Trichostrongylus colubriformis]